MIDPANFARFGSEPTANTSQRERIVMEIEALEMVAGVCPTESAKIRTLKARYNLLVNQEEDQDYRPLSDPLQILPPELWPAFLPQSDISNLLTLTLVSTRWRDCIISTPILWSDITLDSTQEDCLSRAVMCLACSAPLEICVQIVMPLTVWKEVAPIIVAERCRITHLRISPVNTGNEIAAARDILSDFGSLPVLKSLNLPLYSFRPPLIPRDVDFNRWEPFSVDETFLSPMPSLSSIYNAAFTIHQLQTLAVCNFEVIEIHSLLEDTIDALRKCSRLKDLHVIEIKDAYTSEQRIPSSLHSSLSSVESFNYRGLALGRALPCTGSNLRHFNAKYVSLPEIQHIFRSLQSCPVLFDLTLEIRRTPEDRSTTLRLDNIHPLSIRCLSLTFVEESTLPEDSEELVQKRGKAIDQLFQSLVHIMPAVDVLEITGENLGIELAAYIASLRNLRILSRTEFTDKYVPPLVLNADTLDIIFWCGYLPHSAMLDIIRSSTVGRLNLQPVTSWMTPRSPSRGLIPVHHACCRVPPESLPNLRELDIIVEGIRWDLRPFMRLKSLVLSGDICATFAGDIFEDLALHLDICPLLEEITIRGSFVEWDLLILMLKRRNLGGHPGVARIKSIHFDRDIGYRLLRPITELLGGKYPHYNSLEEYSIVALGKLVSDKNM